MNSPADLPPIASFGKYELIWVAFTSYLPVTIGVIGFFVVMFLPFLLGGARNKKSSDVDIEGSSGSQLNDLKSPAPKTPEEIALAKDEALLKEIQSAILNMLASGDDHPRHLELSTELAEKIHSPKIKVKALGAIGEAYKKRGDLTMAEPFLLKSFQLARKHGRRKDLAKQADNLVSLYEQEGDTKKTLEYLRRSLLLFEQAGMPDDVRKTTVRIKHLKSSR